MTPIRMVGMAVILALMGHSLAKADIVVSFDPPFQTVAPGAVFTVDIVASIPEPDATVGWGLDFDIADLTLVTQTATPPSIGPAWSPAATVDGDGLAGLAPTPPGDGIWDAVNTILLATIELQADLTNQGITDLLLSDGNPIDLTEGFALEPPPAGLFADVTYQVGQVEVVPEPASLALFAIGTFVLIRRRGH